MDQAAAPTSAPPASQSTGVAFEDGLGERRRVTDPASRDTLEVLCLRGELTAVPVFEFTLRERVSRLAEFRHACYGRVRSVERLNDRRSTLALVSEWTPGVRLSEILATAERRGIPLDIDAALCLIRQLVPAIAMLHESAGEVAHGSLGLERIVITPNARLVIVEHVLGSALERLRFSHERYWKELRIPLPRSAGLPRFDHRADIMQIGVAALSLILGRPLGDDEYASRLGDVLASACAVSVREGTERLPVGVRAWLARALQIDPRTAFTSAFEARSELDKALGDSGYMAAPAALEAFLARYRAGAEPAVAQTPPPEAVRVEPVSAAAPPLRKVEPLGLPESGRKEPDPMPREESPAEDAAEDEEEAAPRRRWLGVVAAAVVLVAAGGGGMLAARRYGLPSVNAAATGTLAIDTNPTGAQAIVDGEQRGVTPLTLTLKAGAHVIELGGGGEPRKISLTVPAGGQMSQYIEMPKNVSAAGRLQIRTDPPGAAVAVDGAPRGTSPITVGQLTVGEHSVVLTSDLGSVTHNVTIEGGATFSLFVPLSARDGVPVSGWVSVSSPVEVQLYENARLLGTSESDRIMVSAGSHQIEVVNNALGYRATRAVQVAPGKVALIAIKLPDGTIDLNAAPWAEVWIDGTKAGETPLGNVPVTIGKHEVIFRNPDLGEQRHEVTVTATAPARLSVDLRKK